MVFFLEIIQEGFIIACRQKLYFGFIDHVHNNPWYRYYRTKYSLCIYVINIIVIFIPNTAVGTPTQAAIPVTEIINVPVTGPGGSAVTGQFSSHVIVGKVLPCLNESER